MADPPIIREVCEQDHEALWSLLEPVFRAGETYMIERDISREAAIRYWCAPTQETFVAEEAGGLRGTYFLRANQRGAGAHVANCGYITAQAAQGRGIARAMLEHSLARARARGFRAMQFNCVISTNQRALETWLRNGFEIIGRVPEGFLHPAAGYVDALILYRRL